MHLSKRLMAIANLIDTKSIIDVGCDHALLDIYLTKEKKIKCVGTDISARVLENAANNIKKHFLKDEIKLILTDGLENIQIKKSDTIIIAGMGTTTILKILEKFNLNNKLIICSNNELKKLRKKIVKKNYFIVDEIVIFEKGHYYVIIKFEKGKRKYSKWDYLFGPISKKNKDYLKFLYNKYNSILNKLPNKYILKKIKIFLIINKIKKLNK